MICNGREGGETGGAVIEKKKKWRDQCCKILRLILQAPNN
jgi:hypothetical protein